MAKHYSARANALKTFSKCIMLIITNIIFQYFGFLKKCRFVSSYTTASIRKKSVIGFVIISFIKHICCNQ